MNGTRWSLWLFMLTHPNQRSEKIVFYKSPSPPSSSSPPVPHSLYLYNFMFLPGPHDTHPDPLAVVYTLWTFICRLVFALHSLSSVPSPRLAILCWLSGSSTYMQLTVLKMYHLRSHDTPIQYLTRSYAKVGEIERSGLKLSRFMSPFS